MKYSCSGKLQLKSWQIPDVELSLAGCQLVGRKFFFFSSFVLLQLFSPTLNPGFHNNSYLATSFGGGICPFIQTR